MKKAKETSLFIMLCLILALFLFHTTYLLMFNELNNETLILSDYLFMIKREIAKDIDDIDIQKLEIILNYIITHNDKIQPNFRINKRLEMTDFYSNIRLLRSYIRQCMRAENLDPFIIGQLKDITSYNMVLLFYEKFNYTTYYKNYKHRQKIYTEVAEIESLSRTMSQRLLRFLYCTQPHV